MKWTLRKKVLNNPKYGSQRDLPRFALFPTRMGSHSFEIKAPEYTVWLERYYELQEYKYKGITTFERGNMASHSRDGWVTIKKYQVS